MVKQLLTLFGHKTMIILLLAINIPGTIYGFYWYKGQLLQTPTYFLPFVPDSPTASLFFVFVLFAFLFKRNWPLMEALPAVTLIKYGVWAVVMNFLTGFMGGALQWQHYMLIFSHAGMALQAIIYAPYFKIKSWHLVVVAIWTIHNDIIDYVFNMHPSLSSQLMPYTSQIGYFTFWLSLVSLFIVYKLCVKKTAFQLSINP